MRRTNLTVRAIALIGGGSAAVHELRYAIGYGSNASRALAAHPHGYLSVALPGILTALLITMAAVAMRVLGMRGMRVRGADGTSAIRVRGADGAPAMRHLRFAHLWAICAFALATIFAAQETLEGSGAVLHGGWIGAALAIPVGLIVALALRGAEAAEQLAPGRTLAIARIAIAAPVAARLRVFHAQLTSSPLGARGPPFAFAS